MSNSLQPHTVHGIFQARILEWIAFPFSRGSSQPSVQTQVSHIVGRFFTTEPPGKPIFRLLEVKSSGTPIMIKRYVNVFSIIRLPHFPFYSKSLSVSESHSVMSDSFDPMDYIVHGIFQARILEWIAIPFSRGSSQPRNRTQVSCTAGRFFTI